MNYCCVYFAHPKETTLSTGEPRLDMLKSSILNTSFIFDNVDYIIFHTDFGKTEFDSFKKLNKYIRFHLLDSFDSSNSSTCRFFIGKIQTILIEMGYEGYIRFSDDSFLTKPSLERNVFELKMTHYDYIVRSFLNHSSNHLDPQIQNIYRFTRKFLTRHGYSLNQIKNDLIQEEFLKDNMYTGLVPLRFHFSKLSLWTHPLVKEYMDTVFNTLFFQHHTHSNSLNDCWIEPYIHSMILFMVAPLIDKNVHCDTTFGYRLNRYVSILYQDKASYQPNKDDYPKNYDTVRPVLPNRLFVIREH